MLYKNFEEDREYLVGKFRNPVFDPETGIDNRTIWENILSVAEPFEKQRLPKPVVKAHCFEYICRNMQIDVNPHDCFPGFGPYDRNKRPLQNLIAKWWEEIDATLNRETAELIANWNQAGITTIWKDFDHSVPDWDAILELGFPGLRDRARKYRAEHEKNGTLTPEVKAYFDGIEITVNAVLEAIGRLVEYAKSHHSGNRRIQEETECLEQLRNGAPRNFYEALQLIYLHFFFGEHIDFMQVRSIGGNLDVILRPYYERDLEEGRFTVEKMREYMTCFLMQWGSIDNYWGHPFYMGGTGPDGETLYNDVSYLILDVIRELNIPTPKIQLKIAKNTPQELLDTACRMIRDGHCSLVFVSEEGIRRVMMSCGFSPEEARTCKISGCYEFGPKTNSNGTGGGHINLLKIVELILNDGTDPATGYHPDLPSFPLENIKSFGDFFKIYMKNLDVVINTVLDIARKNEMALNEINPSNMFSLTMKCSLENGRDAFYNGCTYRGTGISICGLATTVDALTALKKYVFEKKEVTLTELRDILNRNWSGAELLRTKILHDKDKYGNGKPEVDLLAQVISHFISCKINKTPNNRGGFFSASGHCARQFIVQGEKTGATPDGRLAGEEFSKNLSPTMGMDTNGVTALIRSITSIDSMNYPGDFPLDVMLHPATVQGEDGISAFRGLIKTYFDRNGLAIHFNVFDASELKEAQKNPEKYASLQIRVCGWNVRFLDLPKNEQDAYIKRAENIME